MENVKARVKHNSKVLPRLIAVFPNLPLSSGNHLISSAFVVRIKVNHKVTEEIGGV